MSNRILVCCATLSLVAGGACSRGHEGANAPHQLQGTASAQRADCRMPRDAQAWTRVDAPTPSATDGGMIGKAKAHGHAMTRVLAAQAAR